MPANMDERERDRAIMRTSYVGVAANVALVVIKAVVGLAAGSIAIVLDAVNNLTDAASSVITILGTHFAARPADSQHPFGHGRIEYLSALVVAGIVVGAGASALLESVRKLGDAEPASYSAGMLVALAFTVAVKVAISVYYRRVGRATRSDALIASGVDAGFDAVVLVKLFSLDGILGVVISVVILKAGVDLFKTPLDSLLGTRVSRTFADELRGDIGSFPGVAGVYDLTLHSYGPNQTFGSVNIGVTDTMTAHQIGDITHDLQRFVRTKYGVKLNVGIHAINSDPDIVRAEERIDELCRGYLGVREVHGIYVDPRDRDLSVDVLVDFDITNAETLRKEIADRLAREWPGYDVQVDVDRDYLD